MKAIVLDENGTLTFQDVSIAEPATNELQVRIIASGFNPIDYQIRENGHERKLMSSPILGREFAGIVSKTGSEVTNFKVGDEVYCGSGSMGSNGTYAEYINVPEEIAVSKPKSVSYEEAAGIPAAGLTALQCFNRMNAGPTKTLFITGAAGAVGIMLIKILLAKGIRNFIVTAGNAESIAALKKLELWDDQIIDYKAEDVYTGALSRNGGNEFDIAVDLVGNHIAEVAARLLKANGMYLDVTALSTAQSRETLFNIGAVVINISNYVYGYYKDYAYYKDGLNQLSNFFDNGAAVAPDIEVLGALNVATVERAHYLLRNNQTRGKKLIMSVSHPAPFR